MSRLSDFINSLPHEDDLTAEELTALRDIISSQNLLDKDTLTNEIFRDIKIALEVNSRNISPLVFSQNSEMTFNIPVMQQVPLAQIDDQLAKDCFAELNTNKNSVAVCSEKIIKKLSDPGKQDFYKASSSSFFEFSTQTTATSSSEASSSTPSQDAPSDKSIPRPILKKTADLHPHTLACIGLEVISRAQLGVSDHTFKKNFAPLLQQVGKALLNYLRNEEIVFEPNFLHVLKLWIERKEGQNFSKFEALRVENEDVLPYLLGKLPMAERLTILWDVATKIYQFEDKRPDILYLLNKSEQSQLRIMKQIVSRLEMADNALHIREPQYKTTVRR